MKRLERIFLNTLFKHGICMKLLNFKDFLENGINWFMLTANGLILYLGIFSMASVCKSTNKSHEEVARISQSLKEICEINKLASEHLLEASKELTLSTKHFSNAVYFEASKDKLGTIDPLVDMRDFLRDESKGINQ